MHPCEKREKSSKWLGFIKSYRKKYHVILLKPTKENVKMKKKIPLNFKKAKTMKVFFKGLHIYM